jgi:hypothetical protein
MWLVRVDALSSVAYFCAALAKNSDRLMPCFLASSVAWSYVSSGSEIAVFMRTV